MANLNKSGLVAFRAGLPAAVDRGVKRAAEHVGDLAQQLAPEDSGDLKKSKKVDGADGRYTVSFGEGLPDGRAVFQEYGTADSPAQPYLEPARKAIKVGVEVRKEIATLAKRSRAK